MPRLVAKTHELEHLEWLELRKEGIGGSDAAAIAGVNKYTSPVIVYMEKKNMYSQTVAGEAAYWGNELEPIVRKEFRKRINAEREERGLKPAWIQQRHAMFAHDTYDFMRANVDGMIHCKEKGWGIFEAKTANQFLSEEWEGEDIPNQYYCQIQHYMAVMDVGYAYVAVLIGGQKYKHYYVERDEEFIEYLIAIEKDFWENNILANIPPAFSGNNAEKEMLAEQYPQSEATDDYIVTLPNITIEMVERIDAYKVLIKDLEQQKTADENEIKAIMATTETAFAGSHKITWKTASNGQRRFTIKLDSQDARNKFYDAQRKVADKELKEITKLRKNVEKVAAAQRKADAKARKDAEKALKAAIKEEKAALKAAAKEADEQTVAPEMVFVNVLQEQIAEKLKTLEVGN